MWPLCAMSHQNSRPEEDLSVPHHVTAPDISLRALFKLASPIFVANLSIMGAATIDTIMAGRLGAEHLAAVAVGNAAAIMIFLSLVAILQGLSPIAGHHYGARRYERIGFELSQSGWLCILLAAIGMTLMLQTNFWVNFGRVSGNVAEMTTTFLYAAAAGVVPAVGARAFVALNAAVSRPKVTMWVSLAMLGMKIPLNSLFMYGLFGLPEMGGPGAAMATAVNSWLAFTAYYIIWKRDKYYEKMRPAKFYLPDIKAIAELLKLGVPIGLSSFFEVSSFTLMAIFIARLGTIPVAAHQIVANMTATLYMIPFSLAIAVSVLVSQCLGAGYPQAARDITVKTIRVAMVIAFFSAVLLYVTPIPMVSLYTTDEAVKVLAVQLLLFGSLYHVMDACQTVSGFALRGYRVTFWPMVIYGVLLWAVGLGGGYWVGFGGQVLGGPYGALGFWGATALGLVLAGIALGTMAVFVANTRAKEAVEVGSGH